MTRKAGLLTLVLTCALLLMACGRPADAPTSKFTALVNKATEQVKQDKFKESDFEKELEPIIKEMNALPAKDREEGSKSVVEAMEKALKDFEAACKEKKNSDAQMAMVGAMLAFAMGGKEGEKKDK
ncbi:MAG: hypothetical protein IT462_15785 [Planctomycetes bacterium]|nr:hypothetical protein [Planctomycetota bacterium]